MGSSRIASTDRFRGQIKRRRAGDRGYPLPPWSIHLLIEPIVPIACNVVGANPWESTVVTRVGEGRYSATISPSWNLAVAAQGGVVAAIAARAMEAELGTGQLLRSFHGVFASPVPVGPVEVEVEVIRSGRSISQVRASIRASDARTGFTALAAFGQERPGFRYTELEMPCVPPPEECEAFRDPPPPESGLPSDPLFERSLRAGLPLGTLLGIPLSVMQRKLQLGSDSNIYPPTRTVSSTSWRCSLLLT
jgi:hypothetical protein